MAGTLDVLVIDEGLQLRLGESAIAVRRLRSGGRLVVAGDHRANSRRSDAACDFSARG